MNPRQLQIPLILVVCLVVIAVVNGFADFYHWYWTMRWFDMPMHFAGGVWLAGMAVWWFLPPFKDMHAVSFMRILFIGLGAALGIGLAWELYEAIVGLLTVGHANAMSDTLSDLFFDTVGGTTVAFFTLFQARRANRI